MEQSGACPELADADEYALGFRDGFVDFVYAGGTGEPPPVPPRKFWNVGWRTPAGSDAAQQWFAGYRHGAHAARDGGYRMNGVVQSSQSGAMLATWTGAGTPGAQTPEEIAAPSELLPETMESLEYDEQTLLPPPAAAEEMPIEGFIEGPQIEENIDDAADDGGRDAPALPALPQAPSASSTRAPGRAMQARSAAAAFRRAISQQPSESASAER